jgi:DNA-binding IclR family transcriptional regulator
MSDATEAYHVSRTLGALEQLADGPRSTTQVADALNIHVRTARRTLARLTHDGYAARTNGPRPVYSLTPQFTALADRALRQHARAQTATPQPAARRTG